MKISRRQLVYSLIIVLIVVFLSSYQLDYYIYKPGRADSLESIVTVDDGYESDGSMHLLTVSGSQATPMQYLMAQFLPYHNISSLEEVRPKGVSEEEYRQMQLHMMENSQESSTVVAYEAADANIKVDYNGVYVVSVIEEMPAEGTLEIGDIITSVDGQNISQAEDLTSYVENKQAGETITLEIERDETTLTETIELDAFEDEEQVGIGISLVTNRDVEVEPEVHFSSGKIGGPSAGLVFALDIYDQLIETDVTRGYEIAATGEIDYEGNVLSIGGVDQKVVAADKQGCDIFFAPNDGSNYDVALKTAEDIKSDMEIVPVDTFDDALTYLENIDTKENEAN